MWEHTKLQIDPSTGAVRYQKTLHGTKSLKGPDTCDEIYLAKSYPVFKDVSQPLHIDMHPDAKLF